MKLESKFDLKSIRTRLNDVQREFNAVGKRIENLGISKADYDTIAAILTKQYQYVTKEISEGRDVPGVTDVLEGARSDRAKANTERKAKRTARLAELKGKATLTEDEKDEVKKLEKILASKDDEGTEEAASANGAPAAKEEAFV